jgi:hypothetical protein
MEVPVPEKRQGVKLAGELEDSASVSPFGRNENLLPCHLLVLSPGSREGCLVKMGTYCCQAAVIFGTINRVQASANRLEQGLCRCKELDCYLI